MVILFEFTVSMLFITFVITQMIIPAWKDLPLFPFFRRRKKLAEFAEAKEELEDTVMDKRTESVDEIKKTLRKSKFKPTNEE